MVNQRPRKTEKYFIQGTRFFVDLQFISSNILIQIHNNLIFVGKTTQINIY